MNDEEIRNQLLDSVDAYKRGVFDRKYVQKQINYYYNTYRYMGGKEIVDMLDEIDQEKNNSAIDSTTSDNQHLEKESPLSLSDALTAAANAKTSEEKQKIYDNNPTYRKFIKACLWGIIILIGLALFSCGRVIYTALTSPDNSSDYTTYYNDENGNGQLDRGEGNYTVDEDGNVVDWDEDNNNF